ncbi:hypothetical protein KY284_007843 [Solanum tuberosum]|nr:hypothetical protein KY284_007843 [Solanum tuberosum]
MGMAKISIANEFGPLHDHDTRHVADMGKDFGGVAKVTRKDKRILWEQLMRIHNNQQTPWVAMGDYNTIHKGEDRIVGSLVIDAEIRDFDDYLRDTSMTILKHIEILDPGCSDHSPLSINFVQQGVEKANESETSLALENLNTAEFQGLEARIKKYRHHRQQTQDLQGTMRLPGQPTNLTEAEREAKLNLEKWLNVEESIIR